MISFIEFKENCINLVRGKLKLENASANGELSGQYYYRVEGSPCSIAISYYLLSKEYMISLYTSTEVLSIGMADNMTEAYERALKRSAA